MTYFQSNQDDVSYLKSKIKESIWEYWQVYWSTESEREKHLNGIIRHILNIFDYVTRFWGSDKELLSKLEEAVLFAIKAHAKQGPRKTGEPYISHPLNVASSCAQNGLDLPAVIAAILHDTIEDTEVSKTEIQSKFGYDVAEIVDGLSKVKSKDKSMVDRDKVATFFKIFETTESEDNLLRTIIIKIMDRRDNMKTVGVFRKSKQNRYASETINIYASLATILGMRYIATELFTNSMEPYFPEEYPIIKEKTNQRILTYSSDSYALQNIIRQMVGDSLDIKFIHFFPTVVDHLDLETKKLNFGVPPLKLRIRVHSTTDMYTLLGYIQNYDVDLFKEKPRNSENFQVLHDTWKDYVASPLANGYRALTIQVKFNNYTWVLEILSMEMEDIVDWGILSDFRNKELRKFYITSINAFRDNLVNLSNMRYSDLQAITASAVADIRVRYKDGNIIQLPKGSIVLDLAYIIDEDLGLYCKQAMVNGQLRGLLYQLHHGEHVEILTQKKPTIKEAYFHSMKSHTAREKYKRSVKRYFMSRAYEIGKEVCFQFIEANGLNKDEFFDTTGEPVFCSQDDVINIGLAKYTVMDMLYAHGYNVPSGGIFSNQPLQITREITDYTDLMYSYPTCCNVFPVVDQDVVMQYSPSDKQDRALGLIELHYRSCPHLDDNRPQIDLEWKVELPERLPVEIKALNVMGLVGKITGIIAKNHLNILFIKAESNIDEEFVNIEIDLELKTGEHRKLAMKRLANCIKLLRKVKNIKQINIKTE